MTVKGFLNRFNQLYNTYIEKGEKSHSLAKIWYFIDYAFAFIFQGASLNDYFAFGFYKLRSNGRNEYITFRRYHRILTKCNDQEAIITFRDKSVFNKVYADYLQREVQDVDLLDEESFVRFFKEHRFVFVKESRGFRGNSVWMYDSNEVNANELYQELRYREDAHYVLEEKIVQHPDLAAFHPSSVNTIRIVTLYDDKRDILHFMFAKFRIGNRGAYLDNTHAGGISATSTLKRESSTDPDTMFWMGKNSFAIQCRGNVS